MASKNMFAVLHQDDSDDEKEQPKRQTKHEQRKTDKVLRENTGDRVQKDNFFAKNTESRVEKNTYSGEGKRTYDRNSGTGKNTFNKYEKKEGGGGKGNWGGDQGQINNELSGKQEAKEDGQVATDEPEEQAEPVLTLNDYLKEQNMQMMDTKMNQEKSAGFSTTKVEKGMKILKKADHDFVEASTKTKNCDGLHMSKASNIEGVESTGYRRQQSGAQGGKPTGRPGQNKPKNAKLGNDDFPALG